MFEKLRLLKNKASSDLSPAVLSSINVFLNYEEHAQKLIKDKLPKEYQHFAQHAINVSSIVVGLIPGSNILEYIKNI